MRSQLSKEEWEALCDGCGKCCGLIAPKEGKGTACPGLDVTTNRCTVYKKRLTTYICVKVEPDTVDKMHADGLLPDSCGYVRWSQGKPPLEEPPVATLTPFALAPLSFRRRYDKANKKWQRERR